MNPSRKKLLFYGTGAVFILVVSVIQLLLVSKKKADEESKITIIKNEKVSTDKAGDVVTDKAGDVVGDINEMKPGYIKIASTNFPIVVEDGDHSEELINIAINDINLISLQLKECYIGNSYFTRSYIINSETVQTNASINSDQSIYGPSHGLDLIEIDGKHHLILSNSIMDKYKKAVQFNELYEKEISKLDAFMNRINDDERLNDDELTRLLVPSYDHREMTIKELRKNADVLKDYSIRRPSVLGFSLISNIEKEILMCQSLLINKATNIATQNIFLEFSGTEWQLVL